MLALLLSKLITSVHTAVKYELSLREPICFTDSKVALYWIQGVNHELKQFVENRVTSIRSLVQPKHWKHCPGKDNPADIPSRGMSASALAETPIWLNSPNWLHFDGGLPEELSPDIQESPVPDDSRSEMKHKEAACTLTHCSQGQPTRNSWIEPAHQSKTIQLFPLPVPWGQDVLPA